MGSYSSDTPGARPSRVIGLNSFLAFDISWPRDKCKPDGVAFSRPIYFSYLYLVWEVLHAQGVGVGGSDPPLQRGKNSVEKEKKVENQKKKLKKSG